MGLMTDAADKSPSFQMNHIIDGAREKYRNRREGSCQYNSKSDAKRYRPNLLQEAVGRR